MLEWVRKHIVIVIIGGVIIGGISFVVGIKVADLPGFCGLLCHEMQYYVDSLRASRHTRNPRGIKVICMDCHSEQGFINHAIEHIKASLLLTMHFTKKYKEDYQNKHAEFKKEFEENKCQECHPGRSDLAYFMEVPEYKWDMINENCHRCHEEVLKENTLLERYKIRAINASHKLHNDKGVLCINCHKLVVHGTDPKGFNWPIKHTCFASCHDGKKAPREECSKCHVLAKKILRGTGGRGVEETPGPMSEGVECTDCHVEIKGRTRYSPVSLKVDTKICVDCHEEGYDEMVAEWQADYQNRLNQLEKLYNSLGVERLSPSKRRALGTILKDTQYNLKLIRMDGSRGVHNPDYINALADTVTKNLEYIANSLE